ncbi:hypothetical protein BJP34_21750 [Moorena producens PAL-8-15-08-1]|uniref:Uncharacterized protein n=1 Tax=Moorena producens PAL-8-15-08-1 TaxID=1458985 RepID=A0A1D8TVV9_9CYAN|nr:hypothetical protein BJP34_21750 [Moorena producens PAL-8-15-08-1]
MIINLKIKKLYSVDYSYEVQRIFSLFPHLPSWEGLGSVFKLGDPPKSPLKKGDFEYRSPLFLRGAGGDHNLAENFENTP